MVKLNNLNENSKHYLLFLIFYDKIQQEKRKGEKHVFKETRNARI